MSSFKVCLSIVIPNWNGKNLIEACISSIIKNSFLCYEIIIVDNFSTDGSQEHIKDAAPSANLVCLSQNQGFSKAVNIGIKQAKGDYIAVLNNDTELDPDWIYNVIKAFEENPDIMYITSKIKNFRNKELLDDVGDIILPSGRVYKLGNNEIDSLQYNKKRLVFGASGCASVYRREFFEKVGYFDEDFFAYLEDVDLSFRANLMGYKCLYVPDAVVYHVGSATTGSMHNDFTVFHMAQNTINVIVKNFPTKIFLRSIFNIILYITTLQIFFIIKGFGVSFFKGLLSGLKMMDKMFERRREIKKKRVLSDDELLMLFKVNKERYKQSRQRRIKRK